MGRQVKERRKMVKGVSVSKRRGKKSDDETKLGDERTK